MLTVDLLNVYLLPGVDIVIRYIEVYFTFGLPDYVRYIEEFVISRFYSIHFTVILAGTWSIVRYIEDFVKERFVKSKFHCSLILRRPRSFVASSLPSLPLPSDILCARSCS